MTLALYLHRQENLLSYYNFLFTFFDIQDTFSRVLNKVKKILSYFSVIVIV